MGIFSRNEGVVSEPVFAPGAIEPIGKTFEAKALQVEAASYAEAGAEIEACNFREAANDDEDEECDEGEGPLILLPRAACLVRPTGEAI